MFDNANQLLANVNPLLFRTTMLYDKAGQNIAVEDANANRVSTIYDLHGRVIAIENALGFRTSQIYDAAGQWIALEDANAHRTSMNYDLDGRKLNTIDALSRRTTLGYDKAARQTLRIDARGNRTSYIFDNGNRLTNRQYPDGSRVSFTWDAASQRVGMADLTGRTSWVYDKDGRTSRMQTPAGKIVTYGYDAASQRVRWVTPDGGYFTTTYDGAGRRVNLVNPDGDRTSWTYDNGDRTLAQVLANTVRASYTWDNADHLKRLVNITSGGTTISSFAYRLDGIGNRLGVTEADGTRVTWSFDKTYQLTQEQRGGTNAYNVTYGYDPVSNRLTMRDSGAPTTYSFDQANQLVNWKDNTGTTTVTFDATGNQAVTLAPAGDRTTNTWDFENKLTKVMLPNGVRNTMQSEGDGKRVQKIDSKGTVNFIWDGENVLQEADQNNVSQVTYTLEPVAYRNLISQSRGGSKSYYHFEAIGSTRELTSASAGILNSYVYRAFGTLQSSCGSTTNPFSFVGQLGYYLDPDTLNYDVRARYYGPASARWLSEDPLGLSLAAANLFSYVKNLPTKAQDPSGMDYKGGISFPGMGYGCTKDQQNILEKALNKACDCVNKAFKLLDQDFRKVKKAVDQGILGGANFQLLFQDDNYQKFLQKLIIANAKCLNLNPPTCFNVYCDVEGFCGWGWPFYNNCRKGGPLAWVPTWAQQRCWIYPVPFERPGTGCAGKELFLCPSFWTRGNWVTILHELARLFLWDQGGDSAPIPNNPPITNITFWDQVVQDLCGKYSKIKQL